MLTSVMTEAKRENVKFANAAALALILSLHELDRSAYRASCIQWKIHRKQSQCEIKNDVLEAVRVSAAATVHLFVWHKHKNYLECKSSKKRFINSGA